MPTFVLFKNGEKINEVVGANPASLQVSVYVVSSFGQAVDDDVDLDPNQRELIVGRVYVRY